jgi:primosomal replication protein N
MTNQAIVAGEVISEFQFSHEIYGEGFYRLKVKVQRLSSASDEIPLLISDRLVDVSQNYIGQKLEAKGQFRSYNKHEDEKNHLILSLFVRELEWIDSYENRKPNYIMLDGYVCKEPIYRMTPLGREICDILLAVNRAYGKSDYIPCICWGRNARFAGNLEVGSHIQVLGRIQSRKYQKKVGESEIISRTAYEISVNKLEIKEE